MNLHACSGFDCCFATVVPAGGRIAATLFVLCTLTTAQIMFALTHFVACVRVCCLFLPFASFLQSCSISCGFMVAFPFHSSSHGERSRILEGFLIFGCSVSVLLLISMRA